MYSPNTASNTALTQQWKHRTTDAIPSSSALASPSLPPEILDTIFKYLIIGYSKQELKQFRLLSKSGCHAATPRLFRDVTLYQSIISITNLENIANAPHLRHHVHQLVYYMKYIDVPQDLWLSELQKTASSWYDGPRDHLFQAVVTRLLASLPNINSIVVDGQGTASSLEISDYDTKYEQVNRDYCFQIASLLLAASNRQTIITLEMNMHILRVLQQKEFLREFFGSSQLNLSALRTLKLRDVHPKTTRKIMPGNGLKYLFKTATNLESFTLQLRNSDEMTDFGTRSHHFGQSLFGRTSPYPHLTWSNGLRGMSLRGVSCKMSEFRTFTRDCRTTLESLELYDFVLVAENIGDARPCLVGMFKYIQAELKLDRICLKGHLRNCGLQQWFLQPTPDNPSSLRERVQAFIVHGGSCPIEHFSIQPYCHDLMCRYSQSQVPPILLQSEFAGDSSFVPTYEVIDPQRILPVPDDDPTYSLI